MDITQGYQQIITRFVDWAGNEDNIRAAVIVGSRARTGDHPADDWADLDFVIFARDVEAYLKSREWLNNMGDAGLSFVEHTATGGFFERRVIYAGGLDVDYSFVPAAFAEAASQGGDMGDMPSVIHRGYRVILDKDGYFKDIDKLRAAWQPPKPPTPEVFLNEVEDFWYHTVWTAKHLRRGELWWAKGGCDGALKERLRTMLEWHARGQHGAAYDTWMRGRFLEEWADPQAVMQLKTCFAYYDPDDIWRALFETMSLFHRIATETARMLGLSYPEAGELQARQLVQTLSERDDQGS